MEKNSLMTILIFLHYMTVLQPFIVHFNTTTHQKIYYWNLILFLDLMLYVKEGHIHTTVYTKLTDRHRYLNHYLEHPSSVKNCIFYSQFLRLRNIISKSLYLCEAESHVDFYFFWREKLHWLIQQAWEQSKKAPGNNCYPQTTDT